MHVRNPAIQKLEERHRDRVRDLEAQLFDVGKRLEQLEGELHTACAEALELEEVRNAALLVATQKIGRAHV